MSISALKNILNGKPLILRGDGGKPGTDAYTKEERALCAQIASTLLTLAELPVTKPQEASDELVEEIKTVHQEGMDVATWARAAMRAHVKAVLKHNEENPDAKIIGFPKLRDPTSIQHLFRTACQEVGLTEAQTEGVFPKYGKKEKVA